MRRIGWTKSRRSKSLVKEDPDCERRLFGCFGTVRVLLEEILLLVIGAGQLALNEQVFHLGGDFQGIAVGNDQAGNLANFQSAKLRVQAEDLCRVKSYGFRPSS